MKFTIINSLWLLERFQDFCRWTIVLHRFDGSGSYNRNWNDYKTGFGDASGEGWLGNEYLHYLTNTRSYKLRFDLEDWDGITAYAEYSSFVVTSETDKYRLLLGDYSGTTSTSSSDDATDGFLYHNNQQFTTYDQDNDASTGNCVTAFGAPYYGGFWYKHCSRIRPTNAHCNAASCTSSQYEHMTWNAWRGDTYSLKTIKMMMRPVTY